MCVLMWVRFFVESFSNCSSLFRFLTSSYNTMLAYFLTSSPLFRLFQPSINWLIENLLFYSVICYNSSSLTAINRKILKHLFSSMSENFVDCFFYVCVCECVVVFWTGVRLVSNYYYFCFVFFFSNLSFFLFHLMQGVVWLRVWLVFEFLGQHNLAGFVPQVQSVPGWVSAINVPHPVQMVIPCLLGLGQSAHA